MSAIRRSFPQVSERSFSYLYLANVVGACAGTLVSAFLLIELFGFHRTLGLTAILNVLVAAGALALSMMRPAAAAAHVPPRGRDEVRAAGALGGGGTLTLLFMTGLASLAMEVVWIRQFAPHLGPLVYSFGAILSIYLAATAIGSWWYRVSSRPTGETPKAIGWQMVLTLLGCSALL
jgi:predicted membrane-bound spermidine synthase